jgi:hypothetical protein
MDFAAVSGFYPIPVRIIQIYDPIMTLIVTLDMTAGRLSRLQRINFQGWWRRLRQLAGNVKLSNELNPAITSRY